MDPQVKSGILLCHESRFRDLPQSEIWRSTVLYKPHCLGKITIWMV